MSTRRSLVLIAVAAQLPLLAQMGPYPGQYPGGGYPPGTWPGPMGGGGIPIPFPRRGKGPADSGTASDQVKRSRGKLRKIDEKSLVVAAEDGRTLSIRRDGKTKFFDGSAEIAPSRLKAGDEVSVESTEDSRGYLHAKNVYLEKSAAVAEAGDDSTPGPSESASTTMAPPPAASEPGDPGPPTLKRGAPARRETDDADADETTVADSRQPPAPVYSLPPADPLIEKARRAAASFSNGLPNYVCTELMSRFESEAHPVDWRPLDVVSAEVIYENGREHYRNVAIDNKPAHKSIDQIDGTWSTGEFASALLDLFSRATAADFRYRGPSTASGIPAKVYDFAVRQPNSHWQVQVASQSINPAYKGSVWIDPETGRVLRIEMQARSLPGEFPMDTVESAVDYAKVRIGEGEFLLPAHAENLACQRGSSSCSRNSIDFRNYHKYESDSSVTFGKVE